MHQVRTRQRSRLLAHAALVTLIGAGGAVDLGGGARAQTSGDSLLGEVIVTARKKEERLQDVPSTIAAVTGDLLDSAGARKLSDLTSLTSGISFVGLGGAQSLISVRGDSNRIGSSETGTGVFIDGVFVARQTQLGVGPVDVARVEFLKGPQSTLYGKNTIAGAINIITEDPTWTPMAEVEAGYGVSSVKDERLWHAQAIVSGPLIEDRLAARLVVAHQKRDGYVVDPVTDFRGLGYDATYLRGKVWLKLSEDADWRVTASYRRDNAPRMDRPVPGTGTAVVLGRPGLPPPEFPDSIWLMGTDFAAFSRSRSESLTSDLNIETPLGTLTSLTNYQSSRTHFLTDPDSTRYRAGTSDVQDRSRTFSQELRVAGSAGPVGWLGGAFYFKDKVSLTRQVLSYLPDSANFLAGIGAQSIFNPTNTTTKAVFGQVSYDLTEQLNITGGLRYAEDEKDGRVRFALLNLTGGVLRELVPLTTRSAKFDSLTGNVVASYRVRDGVLLYASYGTGNKAGGFAGVSNVTTVGLPFDEAKVKALEAGMKSDLFDRRVRLNASVFNNDYDNLQLQQTVVIASVTQSITTNAAKARAYGADLEVRAVLSDHLTLDASYTYLHARIKEYQFAPGVVFSGIQPPRNPTHAGVVGLTYRGDVGPGALRLNGNVAFKSRFNNDVNRAANGQVLLAPVPGYHIFNAQVAYAWDNYELSAYVHNLANKEYYAAQTIALVGGYYYGSPAEPRTFEVTLKARF